MAVDDVEVVAVTPVARVDASSMISRSDLQVSMEHSRAFPRSVARFIKDCAEIACIDENVARECIYALPRQEDGQTKMIEGPSARLGEIVTSCWGNCAAGARVSHEDGEFVYAQGFFVDLEKNVRITREVRRRITTKKNKRFGTDMIAVTANAACSIAQRNAVFAGIPKALWWDAYLRARMVVAGKAETIEKKRSEAVDVIKKMGVPVERIFATLGVEGMRDIGVDEIVALTGIATAIREGESTVDEVFPDPSRTAQNDAKSTRSGVAGLKERLGVEQGRTDAPATSGATVPPETVERSESTATTSEPSPPAAGDAKGPLFGDARPACNGWGCTKESSVTIEGKPYCDDCAKSARVEAVDRAKERLEGGPKGKK